MYRGKNKKSKAAKKNSSGLSFGAQAAGSKKKALNKSKKQTAQNKRRTSGKMSRF